MVVCCTLLAGAISLFYEGGIMASISKYEGKKGTTYKATIRIKGYPTQTESFKRKTDAVKWANETETAIHNGKHFQTLEAKKHTVGDMIDRYIKYELHKKPKSADLQKPQLEWWKDEIGIRSMADVTPSLIVECRDKLSSGLTYKGTIRAGATVNRYLAAFSHALTKASKEWEWIENNPMTKVDRVKEPKGRVQFLSENQRTQLLAACQKSRNKSLYLIVMLAISTGARQGELLGLKWENVKFDLKRIVLVDTKNGETRAVPLMGEAFALLKEYSKVRRIDTQLVFPNAERQTTQPMNIRVAFERSVKAASIENFHFHDLRHTCASYLAMNGATLAEIAEVLGHKTLSMVKRYAHLSDQHVSSVFERMNEKIFGQSKA